MCMCLFICDVCDDDIIVCRLKFLKICSFHSHNDVPEEAQRNASIVTPTHHGSPFLNGPVP